jgi:DNA replication initiation complex subunit (GINS family)
MITYNDLYLIVRKEKDSKELQALPESFLEDVREYLADKKKRFEESKETNEVLAKLKKQFEDFETLLKSLFFIRLKKILELACFAKDSGISRSDLAKMLPEERDFFEKIVEEIGKLEKNINDKIKEKKDLKNNIIVKLKEPVQEIEYKGIIYGPFAKNDIANLPKEIAEILIEEKKAIKIE